MAWAKVDDQWYSHRKVVPLSMAARGLWATVLSWSCAQRTPFVPSHMPAFLAGGEDVDGLIDELVAVCKWHAPGHDCAECDDPGRGWVIHNWAEYQDKSLSEKRAEAGREGGKRSGETRRKPTNDEATAKQTKQPDEANAEAGPSLPDPSHPNPDPNPSSPPSDKPSRKPDLLFDAMVEVCNLKPGELTKSARGRVNKAVKELRDVGASPDGVRARAEVHRRRWPNAELTPTSLATNYAQLGVPANSRASPAADRSYEQLDRHNADVWRRKPRNAGATP